MSGHVNFVLTLNNLACGKDRRVAELGWFVTSAACSLYTFRLKEILN